MSVDTEVQKDPTEVLFNLKEGNVLEMRSMMPALDGGKEPVVWEVLEVAEIVHDEPKMFRITFHTYYYDVFLFAATVKICRGQPPVWSM